MSVVQQVEDPSTEGDWWYREEDVTTIVEREIRLSRIELGYRIAIAAAVEEFGNTREAYEYLTGFVENARWKWHRETFPPDTEEGKGTKRRKISPSKRRRVFERDEYRCQYCGSWENLHLDHIVALANGGTDDLDNLQTLCGMCNLRKGVK
jgi:hypothetical protein